MAEVAILGAGLAGIATAHYLCRSDPELPVVLIDCRTPVSYTSAQSGDNYRNWWPHPTMTAFTNHSIDLMEEVARDSGNRLLMTRRGYLLATRQPDIDAIVAGLHAGYADSPDDTIRWLESADSPAYQQHDGAWDNAPRGVDVLSDQGLIRREYPSLSEDVRHLVHVRRAGDINGQQLGQYLLEELKSTACERVTGTVTGITAGEPFKVEVQNAGASRAISAKQLVVAAGPFSRQLAAMFGCEIPARNFYHQKIAFEDHLCAIPREQPFACDLDDVVFDWTEEEAGFLREDAATAWLTTATPGGVHCRPEGGDHSKWLKIGWAYNQQESEPQADLENEPLKNDQFPEIAMRAAARLNPSLQQYVDDFPAKFVHYGGYYTMTAENWPLIGPTEVPGAFVVGALSGFGSMSACAAGKLCAAWMTGAALPPYAEDLSLRRYGDARLMEELRGAASLGVL